MTNMTALLHLPGHDPIELQQLAWSIFSNDTPIQYDPEHMAYLTLTPEAFEQWKRETPYEQRKERTGFVKGTPTGSAQAWCGDTIPIDFIGPLARVTMLGATIDVALTEWGGGWVSFQFNPGDIKR